MPTGRPCASHHPRIAGVQRPDPPRVLDEARRRPAPGAWPTPGHPRPEGRAVRPRRGLRHPRMHRPRGAVRVHHVSRGPMAAERISTTWSSSARATMWRSRTAPGSWKCSTACRGPGRPPGPTPPDPCCAMPVTDHRHRRRDRGTGRSSRRRGGAIRPVRARRRAAHPCRHSAAAHRRRRRNPRAASSPAASAARTRSTAADGSSTIHSPGTTDRAPPAKAPTHGQSRATGNAPLAVPSKNPTWHPSTLLEVRTTPTSPSSSGDRPGSPTARRRRPPRPRRSVARGGLVGPRPRGQASPSPAPTSSSRHAGSCARSPSSTSRAQPTSFTGTFQPTSARVRRAPSRFAVG